MGSPVLIHITAIPLTLFFVACSPIQTTTPIAENKIIRIDEFFSEQAAEQAFSGAVLIVQGDEVLLSSGYGIADIENGVPNTIHTAFHIGSVTKQFTAMAVLILHAQGKIDFEEEVCTYISDCPIEWKEITIHHLLTHTSGLKDSWAFYSKKNIPDVSYNLPEIVSWFKDEPLDFFPGDHFAYSSTGYLLLGHIIEEVSRQSYEGFLRQHIFEPLGMMHTGFANDVTNLAVGYNYKRFEAEYINPTLGSSAGGLCSTVEDLYLWERSFFNEKILPRKITDKLFSKYIDVPSLAFVPPYKRVGYGYGWFVGERYGRTVVGHGGTYNGFRALIERYVNDEISIIILSNLESSNLKVTTFPAETIYDDK
jgi:CubicO group peptidase (beta-lactamase class C family)